MEVAINETDIFCIRANFNYPRNEKWQEKKRNNNLEKGKISIRKTASSNKLGRFNR